MKRILFTIAPIALIACEDSTERCCVAVDSDGWSQPYFGMDTLCESMKWQSLAAANDWSEFADIMESDTTGSWVCDR